MLQSQFVFSGRTFSQADLELIREITRDISNLSLTELYKTVCELLDWKRPVSSWGAGEPGCVGVKRHGIANQWVFRRIHGEGLMIMWTSFPMM